MKSLQKLAMKCIEDLDKKQLIKFLHSFSNRIDLLEKFINEETDFDGEKVGRAMEFGTDKFDLYKNELYQIDGTVKLPSGAVIIPAAKVEKKEWKELKE